jgi:DNA-binding XRE family transcriptional regulator
MKTELFAAARRASGLTIEQAAVACGVSRPTYNAREKSPLDFRLSELHELYNAMDEVGRSLLLDAVNSAFKGER